MTDTAPTKLKILTRAAEVIYGHMGRSELARALFITDRTMRRYLAGDREIPETLIDQVTRLARNRRAEIDDLRRMLRELKSQRRA